MNSQNPYDPPSTPSRAAVTLKPRGQTQLIWLAGPTLAGAILGATVFGPFFRCSGDPDGSSIAAGVFGLAALISAIVHRFRFNGPA